MEKIQAFWTGEYQIAARANSVIYGAKDAVAGMSDAARQVLCRSTRTKGLCLL